MQNIKKVLMQHIALALKDTMECYVEVDTEGALCLPSNNRGQKMLVLHLKAKKNILDIMRKRSMALIGSGKFCPDCGGLCGNRNHTRKNW